MRIQRSLMSIQKSIPEKSHEFRRFSKRNLELESRVLKKKLITGRMN